MFFLDESEWTSDTLDDEWYDDYDTTMISDELLAIMLENWILFPFIFLKPILKLYRHYLLPYSIPLKAICCPISENLRPVSDGDAIVTITALTLKPIREPIYCVSTE